MNVKLLSGHHLEFLKLKGGCIGSSESTLVKIPHCWESHVAALYSISQSYIKWHICHLHCTSTSTIVV